LVIIIYFLLIDVNLCFLQGAAGSRGLPGLSGRSGPMVSFKLY